MKTKILFLSLFLLFSCRSVNKNKSLEKEESLQISKTEISNEGEKSEQKIEEKESFTKFDLTQFSISPIDSVAHFSFIYNGQLISGQTSGVLNFSNEKQEEKEKVKNVINSKEDQKSTIKTDEVKSNKSEKSTTTVERKAEYSWRFWVSLILLIIILWELVKKLFKQILQSNWWLNLLNKLK